MEHLLLKAVATTTTDLGEFEAVISTSAIDREGDIVEPAAMVDALQAWNRPIPLDWNHSTNPEDIVGHVNPESVKARGGEVQASGRVDLDTDRGRHVWRLMKSGTIGFSFGYLIPDGGAFKRADGGRTITALDVFAVTATPSPMNNGTRVLATKALDEFAEVRTKARDDMLSAHLHRARGNQEREATRRDSDLRLLTGEPKWQPRSTSTPRDRNSRPHQPAAPSP